jgi:hypothetical protein
MPRLNPFRRRRSRSEQALDTLKNVAQVWTSVKVGSATARAAKGGAKAYGTAKTAKVAGRPVLKVLAIPAAVGGGLLVWRKISSSSSSSEAGDAQPSAAESRPLGPVATPEAVSPPPGPVTPDPPAGASNPPVAPDPEKTDHTGPPVGPSPTFADETT